MILNCFFQKNYAKFDGPEKGHRMPKLNHLIITVVSMLLLGVFNFTSVPADSASRFIFIQYGLHENYSRISQFGKLYFE